MPRLRKLVENQPYSPHAYEFVMQALDYTLRNLDEPRHVSGAELLDGIRRCAREEFGPMARHVLNTWGVYESRDFGAIVFDLVERGVLARTDDDDVRDFDDGFDFRTVFEREYYDEHPAFRR
ncbi:MAG TPA: Minf_1886 family protein [Candidatus Krumholzibacteria bacterium]|nr:Minf_1886 family protein [Candidatus Krumholzibacteria bacterium]